MNKCQCPECSQGKGHASDCSVHNLPAYPSGPCDCGVELIRFDAELQTVRDLDRLSKLYDQIKKAAANRCALISHRMDQIRGS